MINKRIKLLPPSIFERLYLIYLDMVFGGELKRNKVLKNAYRGKRCFFIGNGPSLSKMNLAILEDKFVFAVNEFYLHPDSEAVKPDFYSLIEPWNNSFFKEDYFKKLFEAIQKLCDKNNKMILFFNIDYKPYIELHKLFKGQEIYYLKALLPILDSQNYHDDISHPHSFMDASSYNAFTCLAYMGFKRIYFIGCDLDFVKNKGSKHFFDDKKKVGFIEGEEFSNERRYHRSYVILKKWRLTVKHFRKKGVKTINAGIGGDNDTCPRISYLSLFKRNK